MQQCWREVSWGGIVLALAAGLSGCATVAPTKAQVGAALAAEETPVPTVPPTTPTPPATPAPLSTRPVGKDIKPTKGQLIGPEISYLGAARADGLPVQPTSVDSNGVPTFTAAAGSGFIIVVEAKAGLAGHEVGRRVFAYQADDPTVRPDLEIISSRDLGDGSKAVCDRMKPNLGGVPAVNPPKFTETQAISNAINDLTCRFETFGESESSCTVTATGDFSFVKKESTQQFCMIVARAWSFPVGDTVLTVRVRDVKGNPGPSKQLRIRHPAAAAVPPAAKKEEPTPKGPKPLPTRGM